MGVFTLSGAQVLTIDEIAQAVRASRAEFGNLFQQAQVGLLAEGRTLFEVVARSATDTEAFAQALRFAQAQGWLEPLIDAIIYEGLEDGRLTQAFAETARQRTGNAALQALANVAAGFAQPHVMYRGIANGMRWTGKVFIDGVATGTGVLIGPNLVLTAWHVVQRLFRQNATQRWEHDLNGGKRLVVEFDDFLALIGRGGTLRPVTPLRVHAHQDWCVIFCDCHSEELADRLPADLSQLNGFWDYVVIRLAASPGLERRWASLDARAVVPKADERIVLFQHPAGQPLKVDDNFIAAVDLPIRTAIARFRFLHYANTLAGSSGGPCFDKSFTLFGLHQGVWSNGPNNGRVTNRGVPIVRVLDHIKERIQELPTLDPSESPVWHLGQNKSYWPVIGCDSFQSIVWRSAVAGNPKLLIVTGEKGRGKTFRVTLLSTMLPDGGHLKVTLSAEVVSKMHATQLVETICTAAGAAAPPLAALADVNSTPSVWLKDEVVPKIIAALDGVRNGRPVWLSITDLNAFEIEGIHASQLLLLLYEQLLTADWLRIVLDGMRGDVPASLLTMVERHRAVDVSRHDIETYLRRWFANMNFNIDGLSISAQARRLTRVYEQALDQDPGTAMIRLVSEIVSLAGDYMEEDNQR